MQPIVWAMAKRTKKERMTTYRVQMRLDAKAKLHALADQLAITQIALFAKIVEWFARQPEEIQVAVLKLYPDSIESDVGRLLVERRGDMCSTTR